MWRRVVTPQVDADDVERHLRQSKQSLPPPTVWLLGKAQSGKTSLVQALTGSPRAEIGSGYRPCTRAAQLYAFPNDEECFLRFLDTRGLGEAGQTTPDDLPALEGQANLLIVVVKAMDHAQQAVLDLFREIRRRHRAGRSSCCKRPCTKAIRRRRRRTPSPMPTAKCRFRRKCRTSWPGR